MTTPVATTTGENHHRDAYHGGIWVCFEDAVGQNQTEDGHAAAESHDAPCARAVTSSVIALLTLLLCLYKLWSFKKAHSVPKTYYVVMGLASAEIVMILFKWVYFSRKVWIHFLVIYLHVMQFMIVCLFYCGLAFKQLHQHYMITRVLYPFAAMVGAYFTFIFVFAVTTHDSDKTMCRQPQWVLFSSSQMALSFVFIVVGAYLNRAISKIQNVDVSLKTSKRVTLWSLITAYTTQAVVVFVFDLTFLLGTSGDCDRVFGNSASVGFNAYEMAEHVVLFVPIWVLLWCWKAGPKRVIITDDNERAHYFKAQRADDDERDSERGSLMLIADGTALDN